MIYQIFGSEFSINILWQYNTHPSYCMGGTLGIHFLEDLGRVLPMSYSAIKSLSCHADHKNHLLPLNKHNINPITHHRNNIYCKNLPKIIYLVLSIS